MKPRTRTLGITKRDVEIIRDLQYVCERLEWRSLVGAYQAQKRINELHAGKYAGDREGFFVQTRNAINRLSRAVTLQ
jgi:hypothetical protein